MLQKRFFTPDLALVLLAAFALFAFTACGKTAAPQAASKPAAVNPSVASQSPAPPVAPSSPPAAQNGSSSPSTSQSTAPGVDSVKPGSEGAPGAEGAGRPEGGASVASVTDPGGLPPSPATNDPLLAQIGEEKMVVYRDSQNRYQVLFVNGWVTGTGDVVGSVKSSNQDRSVQIVVVSGAGKSAMALAAADEAGLKTSTPGYQTIVIKPGQTLAGQVVSLIYRYQAGQNPVTGKPLEFIAARVYIPRAGSSDVAVITTTGPAAFYGDLSEIFDRVVSSFKWI